MNDLKERYDLFSSPIDDEIANKIKEYINEQLLSEEQNMLFRGKLFKYTPNQVPTELKHIVIPRMDLVLTTRCTLKCKKCANLMQYYDKPYDVDVETIKKSMDNLLKTVDYIGAVYVLGGEPFLYHKLDDVVTYLYSKKNIGVIKIVTNGTICSDRFIWEKLCGDNIIVTISNYGKLSRNIYNIMTKLREKNVNYYIMNTAFFLDTGNLTKRNRKVEDLKKVFKDCGTLCKSLFDGKLYICPRAAHGMDLGYIPDSSSDYVDLLSDIDYDEELRGLLGRRLFVSCDYCDIRTPGYYDRKYRAAEQISEVK